MHAAEALMDVIKYNDTYEVITGYSIETNYSTEDIKK